MVKVDFDTKLPKGIHRKVDGYIKVGKRSYKVVSGMPENKAWNLILSKGTKQFRSVDKSLARSFELRVVGITRAKDDRVKLGLKKVRAKRGRNRRVLPIVEKSRFALDSVGEKQGLKARRRVAKKKVTRRKPTKKKVSRRKPVKRRVTKRKVTRRNPTKKKTTKKRRK